MEKVKKLITVKLQGGKLKDVTDPNNNKKTDSI